MNLPMLDVCLKQSTPKFIVGDPHQQIYAFNGAVNGMNQVKSDLTFDV
jgi:superfamily I DNA/RNA helicase